MFQPRQPWLRTHAALGQQHPRRLSVETLEARRLLTVVTVETEFGGVDFFDDINSLSEAIIATNIVPVADEFASDLGPARPSTNSLDHCELEITEVRTILGDVPDLLMANFREPLPIYNAADTTVDIADAGTATPGWLSVGGSTNLDDNTFSGSAIWSLSRGILPKQFSHVSRNSAIANVMVADMNDAPVAHDDLAVTDEDAPVTIDLTHNDTDVDGTIDDTALTIAQPPNGSVTDNGDGTVNYTPNLNFNGSDSFTYTVQDDDGATSNSATVIVTVADMNDAPVAHDDSAVTDEDAPVTIDLTHNDTDVDGTIDDTALTIAQPPNGSVTDNGDGTVSYTPSLNFNGSDSFTYTVQDDDGASSNPVLDTEVRVRASDADLDDRLGQAVAISGSIAVAGSSRNDDAGSNSGAAYLFDVTTGEELFKLTAADATARDLFGHSVAISGATALVGAFDKEEVGSRSGAAYLFDATTGDELFKLVPSDGEPRDFFGHGIAIDGNRAVIGSNGDDDLGSASGSAYVFDVTTGTELMKLTASDAAAGDQFGYWTAISGNIALVGAKYDDDGGQDAGSAYVFDVATGTELMKLTASDGAAYDEFGYAVAIDGNTAIVGAYRDDDAGHDSGSVYVFDVTTGDELFKLTASDAAAGDNFGYSLGICGNTVFVGSFNDDDLGSASGSAYLFDLTTGNELMKLTASDGAAGDEFGTAVGISGNAVVVGAWRVSSTETADIGQAYLFDLASTFPLGSDFVYGGSTVTVTVADINDAPVANDDSATTGEHVPVTIDLTHNDTDVDGTIDDTALTIAQPPNGSVTDNGDGTVNYTPNLNFNGSDSFTYTVQDDDGASSNPGTVNIVVNALPQDPADFDSDNDVDGFDFLAWQRGYGMTVGATRSDGDSDDDGDVDGSDLTSWEASFGNVSVSLSAGSDRMLPPTWQPTVVATTQDLALELRTLLQGAALALFFAEQQGLTDEHTVYDGGLNLDTPYEAAFTMGDLYPTGRTSFLDMSGISNRDEADEQKVAEFLDLAVDMALESEFD